MIEIVLDRCIVNTLSAQHLQFDPTIFHSSTKLESDTIDVYCKEMGIAFTFISHRDDTSSQIIQKLGKLQFNRHVYLVDTSEDKQDMTQFIATLQELSRDNQRIIPYVGYKQCIEFMSEMICYAHVSYETEFENYVSSFVQDENVWLRTMGKMTSNELPIPSPQCYMIQEELGTMFNFVNASSQTLRDCCLDKSTVKAIQEFFE